MCNLCKVLECNLAAKLTDFQSYQCFYFSTFQKKKQSLRNLLTVTLLTLVRYDLELKISDSLDLVTYSLLQHQFLKLRPQGFSLLPRPISEGKALGTNLQFLQHFISTLYK